MTRKRCSLLALLAWAMALQSAPALAQSWPSRPVRVMVGFAPGGPNDIIGRAYAARLAEKLEHETLIPVFDTPGLFAAHLKKERAAWEAVIRRNAIVPD